MIWQILLIGALLSGNTTRVPLLAGGVTLLDLVVLMLMMSGGLWFIIKKPSIPKSGIWLPLGGFLALMSLSTLWGIACWGWDMGSVLYLPRLFLYLLLFPLGVTWIMVNPAKRITTILWSLIILTWGMCILGFLQVYLLPSFAEFETLGWDPHEGRLLSTWYDPNFVAGFLAFMGAFFTSFLLKKEYLKSNKMRAVIMMTLAVILTALFLTYSRSGWLSFVLGAGFLTLIYSWRIFVSFLVAGILAISFSPRAQERIIGGFDVDASASFRIESWQNAFGLWQESPWLGIGYNYLRIVQEERGLVADDDVHSAGGSDSSFLTILVTGGIFAAFFWLVFMGEILLIAWQNFKKKDDPWALGVLVGTFVLLLDSWFINSLLFPFIMAPWIAAVIVVIAREND